MIDTSTVLIALFVAWCCCKPKHQAHGHGNPDADRQRAMRLLIEERERRGDD